MTMRNLPVLRSEQNFCCSDGVADKGAESSVSLSGLSADAVASKLEALVKGR